MKLRYMSAAKDLLHEEPISSRAGDKITDFKKYIAKRPDCLEEMRKLDKIGVQLLSISFTVRQLPQLLSFKAHHVQIFSNHVESHPEIDRRLKFNRAMYRPFYEAYCALDSSHRQADSLKRKCSSADTQQRKKLAAPSIAGGPAIFYPGGPRTPAAHPTDADPEHPVAIQPSAATGGEQASGILGYVGIPRSESRESGPPSPIHSSHNTPSQLSGQPISPNNPIPGTNLPNQRIGHVL
ncbi:hypothetical protein B0T19DRAFT_411245 [Cercophora scortea]|uniref:Uncharacterized protein n=1 Tax=Cercophora scortea TaxID=314031 RepID=A0AAE0J5N5_9PEZI|nr:hypothetical protein B0T19DRAFT_411245 [Cercophora scortea]